MQPDSERFSSLPDTQIYAGELMDWHLLLNSTSSWIRMKRTSFFSSVADAATASRGLYGKVTGPSPLQKAGAWRFQLAPYKRRGTGEHTGTIKTLCKTEKIKKLFTFTVLGGLGAIHSQTLSHSFNHGVHVSSKLLCG